MRCLLPCCLLLGLAVAAPAARAQRADPGGAIHGEGWRRGQNLHGLHATQQTHRQRVQARHAHHFPGTPRPVARAGVQRR